MKRIALVTLLLLVTSSHLMAQPAKPVALPTDAEIRKILIDRIDVQKQGVDLVVGIVDPTGRRVVAYARGGAKGVDGDSLFEIGSVTKVFTALLLADAVARGEVSLDDPVSKFVPAGVKVPQRGGRKITLIDLATHTSGLPRLPSNLQPKNAANPYADYTVEQLYDFLSSYELTRDIGSHYEYSNLGGGLLGHLLARRAGTTYEELVRTRITRPLGMASTTITLTPELAQRLVPGHDHDGQRVANWDLPALAGAGALRSSANDLLTFLAANLGLVDSPLSPAMRSMLKTRRPTGAPGLDIALGWHVSTRGDREIVWHNGGTGGYRSFVGFDLKRRLGVVALSNQFTDTGVDDLGQHLLDPSAPLLAAPRPRTAIAVDSAMLDRYVGRYQLAPEFILTITRDGNHLFAQATGQPRFEIFAESAREWFLKVVDAQITFEAGPSGPATGLILHQGGRNMPAKRMEGPVPESKPHQEIQLSAAVLDRYVGRYQLAPAFVIAITREGDHLYLQATGQGKAEMFAEGERDFFLTVVDAQVTFVSVGEGLATKMILHQNGQDLPGTRVQ